jgi:uncharacterized membrane protein
MKWPWGSELTYKQAEETAKYLLNISQATIIGAVGSLFIPNLAILIRIVLLIFGVLLGFFLYLFAMRLFKEVKLYEYRE